MYLETAKIELRELTIPVGGSWAVCCSVGAAAVSLTAGSVSEMIRHSQTSQWN